MRLNKIKLFILTALILTIISLYPSTILAQTVAVTGTITDTQTTPYSNGLLTVTFVNATGQLATFGGNPSFQKSYAIYLDANGAFTISLPPNSTASPSIQPAGTQWNFSYQSQGGYGAANINVTITGAGSISGTLSNLARITWPYGNIPPPGASGQGIVFVSSTTLGWGTTGTAGAVTHTAGNLTLNSMMLGNGVADAKVDSACVTNGTGALSGCTSIATTGSISTGSGASACGAGTTACFAGVEAATACTPTAGQICKRFDSVTNNSVTSANGAAEVPDLLLTAPPAGSKCLQTSGTSGGVTETAGACASAPSFPVTVGGTVTSGGIPYFNSTVQESSSALLAANALVVGGGAGAAPGTGSADFTYASHTLTGGAAGIVDLNAETGANALLVPYNPGDPTVNGSVRLNSTFGSLTVFSGQVNYIAVAGRGTNNTSTTCTNQVFYQILSTSGPTCTSLTPAYLPGVASTTPVTASNPTINTDTNLIVLSPSAGYFNVASSSYEVRAAGNYTTTAASSPALTFRVKLCTVSGCGSGTVVTLASFVTTALSATALTNATWTLAMDCVTNATGATGNLVCKAMPGLTLDTGATLITPDSTFVDANTATSSNIDLTAALFVQVTVAQSVVGASNSYVQTLAKLR